MISYADDTVAPYSLGTVATYSCNVGYELVGDVTRTCEEGPGSSGGFGGEQPSCQRMCCFLSNLYTNIFLVLYI